MSLQVSESEYREMVKRLPGNHPVAPVSLTRAAGRGWQLYFELDFRITPYVRMTQKGKYVKPAALKYLANQNEIKAELIKLMTVLGAGILPGQTSICVRIQQEIFGAMNNHDVDNTAKALLDAMTGIVYPDDRWVDDLAIKRVRGTKDLTVIEVGYL